MSDFETRAEIAAYYEGMKDGAGEYERELNTRKTYQAILTDLIADLRDAHADGDVCSSLDAADRAEARLREAGGGRR